MKLTAKLLDLYMLTSCDEWHAAAATKACRQFLLLYSSLNKQAESRGVGLWRIKPKFHLMQELFETQTPRQGNPRHFWAYKDESFVGLIATIAHPRGGPHTVKSVPVATMNKYRALAA